MFNKTLGAAALTVLASAATAETVTYSASVDTQLTNFTQEVSVSQFNASLGELQSVMIDLRGFVSGSARVENEGPSATNITAMLGAEISLSTSTGEELAVVLPSIDQAIMLESFDGTLDFGGLSGRSLDDQFADAMDTGFVTGSDMAPFIGGGDIDLILEAIATSTFTGSGNLTQSVRTFASAEIDVTYDYTAVATVPVPAAASLMLLALGGLGFAARRKS